MRYKIKRKQADGSFVELSLDTSIDSIYRVKDGNIKSLTNILTEEYAPIDNPVFTGSISLGRKEGTTVGENSYAVGVELEASGPYSHAEGGYNTASAANAHVEGNSSKALGKYSHAEGNNCKASEWGAHAEGRNTIASGSHSHAEGFTTRASGLNSHAEGLQTKASGANSHAEGYGCTASNSYAHAEGYMTKASSVGQHVQGNYNIEDAADKYAHIVGNGSADNNRSNAHTLDWDGNAWYAGDVQANNIPYTISSKVLTTVSASDVKLKNGITVNNLSFNTDRLYYMEFLGSKKLCSLVIREEERPNNLIVNLCNITCNIGDYTIVANSDSYIDNIAIYISKLSQSDESDVSDETIPNATDLVIYEEEIKYLDSKYLESDLTLQNSISMGRVGKLAGGSTALGNIVEASGYTSHAEGSETIASGDRSHAEGLMTTASGSSSHAEGSETTASRIASHAEGSETTASGDFSHAEGQSTTASANSSHAEGFSTTASGFDAHAEGDSTIASGSSSHAEGCGTIASGEAQHVQGNYNIEDAADKYAHIVGNGADDSTRSNAHTLDWDGNAWYAGKLSQDGTPTGDNDLTTKKYVDTTLDTKVAALVDSAPETLDTLKELSTALGDDPNFATTVATNIGTKLNKPTAEGTEGQVLSKAADGSNVWVDNGINEDALNAMLTNTFGFVAE